MTELPLPQHMIDELELAAGHRMTTDKEALEKMEEPLLALLNARLELIRPFVLPVPIQVIFQAFRRASQAGWETQIIDVPPIEDPLAELMSIGLSDFELIRFLPPSLPRLEGKTEEETREFARQLLSDAA